MDILKEPAVLFFLVGVASVFLNTRLEIPNGLSKFLSLYLLFAIGFKGGLSLSKSGLSEDFFYCLTGGVLIAMFLPFLIYSLFSRFIAKADAAAIGATYGSVSAVTFVAGITWLDSHGIEAPGYMTAVLALMEAPAIIVALYLYGRSQSQRRLGRQILHESFFNSSVYLLLASLAVGFASGPFGKESVGTLVFDLFKGLLCFFLLDLGIKAGSTIKRLELPVSLILSAFFIPLVGATLAMGWCAFFSIPVPQAFLLVTMAAGASYIAVPAALQLAIPEARPGIYLTMAFGLTFPFNILIGIPLYWWILGL